MYICDKRNFAALTYMKIVYIAHPISGDVEDNLEKIRKIIRMLNLSYTDVVPFAPYWVDCHALDDSNPEERKKGIMNDHEFFKRKCIDEIWLFGDHISEGMKSEIRLAKELAIPVIAWSPQLNEELKKIW